VKAIPRTARKTLINVCRQVTNRSSAAEGLRIDGPEALLMRDRILAGLEAALEPWLGIPGALRTGALPNSRDFKIFKGVTALLEQHDLPYVPAADVLATELGVSRRKLFYAFRNLLGMGPHAYLELVRLHRLRHRLLDGKASGVSVTSAATELGFHHLGRLSDCYRRHFGELPKETLKRGSR
jgi:AraC-like DNA-binding protein